MIVSEQGLDFTHDGDPWRCIEWFELVMLPRERYHLEGREFDTLAGALAATRKTAVAIPVLFALTENAGRSDTGNIVPVKLAPRRARNPASAVPAPQ